MSVSWQDRLDDATSVHDVVEVARDYLATWDHHEIAALPEPCRPGKIVDENDITSYALLLVQNECEHNTPAVALMQKMATFFSNASVRVTEIIGKAGPVAEGQACRSA